MPKKDPKDREDGSSWLTRGALLMAFLVLGGTLYIYSTTLNPGLPILAGGGLAIVCATLRLARGAGAYYHWGMDVSAALLFWMSLCAANGLDGYLAQRSLLTFVGGVAFLWVAQCSIGNADEWRLAGQAFVAFCTIVSLLAWPPALVTAMETGSLPPLVGTFVNPDTFSILPLLGITLGMGLFERATRRWIWVLCAELGVLFLTMTVTGCRSSLLGFSIAALAFFVLLFRNRKSEHLQQAKSLLAVPLFLGLLALPLSNFGFHVFGKFAGTLTKEAIARETTRYEVATLGWKAVANRPLLGTGPGCFGLGFQTVRKAGHDRLYINLAHNDPMEMAVELGVLGGALWIALLLACFSKTYRLILRGRRPVAAAGAFAAVLAVTVYSLFNFVVSERPVLWAEMFVLGLALSFPSSRLTYSEPRVARVLCSLGLFAFGVWAAVFGYRAVRADALHIRSNILSDQLQLERAMSTLDEAIALQPDRVSFRLERAKMEESWSAFYPGHDGLPQRISQLSAARESSPANLAVLLESAEVEMARGDVAAARQFLKQAQQYAPYHKNVRDRRAALAIEAGDLREAMEILLLEDEPGAAADARLVSLLVSLELAAPGKGVDALKPYLNGPTETQALTVLDQAIVASQDRQLWDLGLRLSDLESDYRSDDLCAVLRRGSLAGKAQGQKQEWLVLDQAVHQNPPNRDPCYGALLSRWSTLGLARGNAKKVEARLRSDLDTDPRLVTVRVALGELHLNQKRASEGISVLRAGLDSDSRSVPLLRQLAKLYEQTGSLDLALTYYSEAARVDPADHELKAKIDELKKRL